MIYRVTLETREYCAIGKFYPHTIEVETNSERDAIDKAVDRCHDKGYETRGILRVSTRGSNDSF